MSSLCLFSPISFIHSTYPPAGHALILRLARYVLLSDNANPLQPQRCCYDDLLMTLAPPSPHIHHTPLPFPLSLIILITNRAPCAWLSSPHLLIPHHSFSTLHHSVLSTSLLLHFSHKIIYMCLTSASSVP